MVNAGYFKIYLAFFYLLNKIIYENKCLHMVILMSRVILHCDMNNFYASVECLYNPELREKPMAVCGDPEKRHGIVLAKNYKAKRYGVTTGEALWQAKQKCPDIVFVPARFETYMHFS